MRIPEQIAYTPSFLLLLYIYACDGIYPGTSEAENNND